MAEPPSDTGAVNATDKLALPAVMLLIVGATGVVNGVAFVADEAVPVPIAFTARILTA